MLAGRLTRNRLSAVSLSPLPAYSAGSLLRRAGRDPPYRSLFAECLPCEGVRRSASWSQAKNSGLDPGSAKTRAFNLLVENSSQFSQSENQTCRRRLSEEGNRENGSTLFWLAHVFTRSGPTTDIASEEVESTAVPAFSARRDPKLAAVQCNPSPEEWMARTE